ncbi:MFS transporter, partial [Actinomadura sp. KC345]
MVFYSLGSALGAAATTALFDATGRLGPAALALGALVTWSFFSAGGGRRGRRGG